MRLSDISNQMMQFFRDLADACLEEQYIRPIPIRSQSSRSSQDLQGESMSHDGAYDKPSRRRHLDY